MISIAVVFVCFPLGRSLLHPRFTCLVLLIFELHVFPAPSYGRGSEGADFLPGDSLA
jgi:hypothetical protein